MPAASNEIVVNTGPLIALDACGQVELLHGLHPRVIVPQAVVTELTSGTHAAGAQVFNIPQWTVGVLLRAKREGTLPAIRPCLEAMRSRGVWLSDRLIAFALSEAGEH
jgi:predicted nucleic acid-binding protein